VVRGSAVFRVAGLTKRVKGSGFPNWTECPADNGDGCRPFGKALILLAGLLVGTVAIATIVHADLRGDLQPRRHGMDQACRPLQSAMEPIEDELLN